VTRRILIAVALAVASFSALPLGASAATDDDSISYVGDVTWLQSDGATFLWDEIRFDITCADKECVASYWPAGVFGGPRPSFSVDSPTITTSTEAVGRLCGQEEFAAAKRSELTVTPDRLTGWVEWLAWEGRCADGAKSSMQGWKATIDFPRVAGNPCILDADYEGCATEAAATPTPSAEELAVDPVAEEHGEHEQEGGVSPLVVALIAAIAVAAVATVTTVAVRGVRKAAKPSPDPGLTGSAALRDAFANADGGGSATEPSPQEMRARTLQGLQQHVENMAAEANAPSPSASAPDAGSGLTDSATLRDAFANADGGGSATEPSPQEMRARTLQGLQQHVENMTAEANATPEPPGPATPPKP